MIKLQLLFLTFSVTVGNKSFIKTKKISKTKFAKDKRYVTIALIDL